MLREDLKDYKEEAACKVMMRSPELRREINYTQSVSYFKTVVGGLAGIGTTDLLLSCAVLLSTGLTGGHRMLYMTSPKRDVL